MNISNDKIEKMRSRRDGQKEWLKKEAPQIFEEQKHLDKDTPERHYWHYGYMMALDDCLERLFK